MCRQLHAGHQPPRPWCHSLHVRSGVHCINKGDWKFVTIFSEAIFAHPAPRESICVQDDGPEPCTALHRGAVWVLSTGWSKPFKSPQGWREVGAGAQLSSSRSSLFLVNSTTVANQVRSGNLLIQVSLYCNTCIQYITLFCSYRFHVLTWMTTQRTSARNWSHTSLYYRCWRWLLRPDSCCEHYRCAVLWHLTVWFLCMYGVVLLFSSAPEGTLSGPFTIPTVLVQETLLALLPCQPMDKVTRF